jgi:hypothetical protein
MGKAATYTQNNTNTMNAWRHLCLEWDSNTRSQLSSGRTRFMPYTTRPLWRAYSLGYAKSDFTDSFGFCSFYILLKIVAFLKHPCSCSKGNDAIVCSDDAFLTESTNAAQIYPYQFLCKFCMKLMGIKQVLNAAGLRYDRLKPETDGVINHQN